MNAMSVTVQVTKYLPLLLQATAGGFGISVVLFTTVIEDSITPPL